MRLMQKSRKTIRRAMYFLHFLCSTSKFMVLMYEGHYAKCQAITIRYGHCSLLWTVLQAPLHLSKFESAWKESKKDSWNRKRKKVTKHTQRKHIRAFSTFCSFETRWYYKREQHKRIVVLPVIAINIEMSSSVSEK